MTPHMEKRFFFLSGLPRSGSTLLGNILFQNPRFHVTGTSGVLSLLKTTRLAWSKNASFRAMPEAEMKAARKNVLQAIPNAFYRDVERPVIFDKSRGWTGSISLIETLFEIKPKILVCVRDIREILASLEKLRLKNVLDPSHHEMAKPGEWATIEGRCRIWFGQKNLVGKPFRLIQEALTQGHASKLLFVDYHQLTRDPHRTLSNVYTFLGELPYPHDFQNVESRIVEDDGVWRVPGLHKIRPVVSASEARWQDTIPVAVGRKFPGSQLWQDHLPKLGDIATPRYSPD